MDVLATGLGALEGPVVCQDGSVLVTSIDRGKLYRLLNGRVEIFAATGGGPNGATEGLDSQIFVAQNGGVPPAKNEIPSLAGVQVVGPQGDVRMLGSGMHSPNDLCFGPDGLLYVTDPTRKPERDEGRIWRCNVQTGECTLMMMCDWYPNGIGFGFEDDYVYVADSRHCRIVRIPLEGFCTDCVQTVIRIDHGIPDGFAFDAEGDLLVACPTRAPEGGDVQVYADGKLRQVIKPGTSKLYTNLAISPDGRIYVCDADTGSVLCDTWRSPALPLHPFRIRP